MNIITRILVALGSLIVIVLFAALIAPYFINWDGFTEEFEREASKVIGQRVQVGGDTQVRLLPLPALGFNDLKVGENPDGTPMMTVDEFSLTAELFPFLSGEVRIVEMNMQRPRVNVSVKDNGTIAWTSPGELLVNPEQVNIERLNVFNGELLIAGLAGGREFLLEKINATIDAKSLNGPWRIEALAEIEGEPSRLKIQTGVYQDDQSIRLRLEAEQEARPYRILLDGPLKLKDNILEWAGDFMVSPFSKSKVAEMIIPQQPLPVQTQGRFVARPGLVTIPEYRTEIGEQADPYTLTGSGNIAIGEQIFFRFKADGRQIDLDQIKAAESAAGSSTLEKRLAGLRGVFERIPIPSIDGEINIMLPALVAGDTYIRDVSAVLRPKEQGWDLRSFSAKFPGNSVLEARGQLGVGETFGFEGGIILASRQPSGFASWISGGVDPAFRKLNSFGIAADVSLSDKLTSFEDMELLMDDAVLQGSLQRIRREVGRPSIKVLLQGNRVDVENLRAIYSLIQTDKDNEDSTHDLEVDLKADRLEALLGGETIIANGVDAKLKVSNGAFSVDRLNAEEFYGAKINTSGRIDDLLSKPNGNMKFTLSSDNLSPLLKFSKSYIGDNRFIDNLLNDPDLTRSANLEIELDTSTHSSGSKGQFLTIGNIAGSSVDMRLSYTGSFNEGANLPISITGKLENEQPSLLLRQLGIETVSTQLLGDVDGPLSIDFDFSGKSSEGLKTQVSLQLPETNMLAQGSIKTQDWNDFESDLSLTLGSSNIAPYAVLVGVNVPGLMPSLNLPISLSFDYKSTDESTLFENITGQISGNNVSGNLLLAKKGISRPRLSGNVKLDRLDVAMLAKAVFGRQSLMVEGLSNELGLDTNLQNFTQPYYQGLDAELNVESANIAYADLLDGKEAKFKLVMLDGAIDLSQLDFDIFDGKFTGSASLKNTQGAVLTNLRYSFGGISTDQFMRKLARPEFTGGKLSLQGTAEATGQSIEALIANLAGNGLLRFEDLTIDGFDPTGFDEILLETGADEYEINTEQIKELVQEALLKSSIEVPQLEAPFSITRGKLSLRNVSTQFENAKLVGDFEYDFPSEEINSILDVTFDPGRREAIQGSEPQVEFSWSGPLVAPSLSVGTQSLEGYLALRSFERSQRRVETLEAQVLEKQRLQQEIALTFAKEQYFERQRLADEARLEAERLEAERIEREAEEARQKALEAARLEAERLEAERIEAERLEAERQAAEEAAAKLEAERERQRQEAIRLEEQRKAKAQEAARRAAQQKQQNENQAPSDGNSLRQNILKNLENFLNPQIAQ